MVTKSNLQTILSATGLTIVDGHTTTDQVVNLPYIVLIEGASQNFKADNQAYAKMQRFMVILISGARDTTHESSIETIFDNNHIFYEKEVDWDEDNLIYTTQYDV